MQYFLLVGAALNFLGALKLGLESIINSRHAVEEYLQLKLFVFGVATTFGLIYLYLYFNPVYIHPFLVFGAGLKAWAFVSCFFLFIMGRIGFRLLFEFGITNGVVAVMFMILLANHT